MRLRRIEPVLRRALRAACAVPPGGRVLVAVSGGADSTALLLGLQRLAPEFGFDLTAAHLHHGLRGVEADGDLAFVRALCERRGIPLLAARWDTRARMRRRGLSGQNGLRRLRREFLLEAGRRAGACAIATAHTADDQLETLLLRLGRGTGITGLGAMSPRRGPWIRPLLEATRADIGADLLAAGERWREDSSNADLRYARNRVRHQVVPGLARAFHGRATLAARGSLARRAAATSRDVRAAARLLGQRANAALGPAGTPAGSGRVSLDLIRLGSEPALVRRLALRRAWSRLSPDTGLTAILVERLDRLAVAPPNPRSGQVDLPEGWVARRQGDTLRIEHRGRGIEPVECEALDGAPLRVPGRSRLRGVELRAAWLAGTQARRRLGRRGGREEFFAAADLEGSLELRPGRTDEWFTPFGRRRARKLGAFLKQIGVPRADRNQRLVLADGQGILWVVGVRRGARAPLTSTTRKALWITTKP